MQERRRINLQVSISFPPKMLGDIQADIVPMVILSEEHSYQRRKPADQQDLSRKHKGYYPHKCPKFITMVSDTSM